mmetsp:Transcript_41652/g.163584  ORF Transcript_41652/g.163584 Transcript_41652/m.163584 type:complete len:138 (-) Transcript_41652:1029-1442(-)
MLEHVTSFSVGSIALVTSEGSTLVRALDVSVVAMSNCKRLVAALKGAADVFFAVNLTPMVAKMGRLVETLSAVLALVLSQLQVNCIIVSSEVIISSKSLSTCAAIMETGQGIRRRRYAAVVHGLQRSFGGSQAPQIS